MKNFSLLWFKSKRQKELEALKVEEQRMKNEKLRKELYYEENEEEEVPLKSYKSMRLVNDVLTIILNDGDIITKSGVTSEKFEELRKTSSEKDLLLLLEDKQSRLSLQPVEFNEEEENEKVVQNFDILKDSEEFIVEDDTVYMKGIHRSIPSLLASRFVEILQSCSEPLEENDKYQALKKFWMKCCLNPNAQSAEDLYTFLSHHQFKIDRHGNFYAYRRVVSVNNNVDKELVDFISNAYNKVKAIWKKKPSDYNVYKSDGEYTLSKLVHVSDIDNLESLYQKLPDMIENRYTDNHTHKEDYRVGRSISMPRDKGDDNNMISCSLGYHAASKKYNYTGFGDTPILMIVNPVDVLAVPLNEVGKLRTCRWFFAMTLPEEEQYILDDEEFDVTELGDKFEEECLEDLEQHVKRGFAEEVKRHTFNLTNISSKDITKIVSSLEQMKDSISKRVVNVK